jgi:methylenetetrahydrofolate reductase (NADPH)
MVLNPIIVHNDFHQTHELFSLFDGLQVEEMDEPVGFSLSNGDVETNGTNGGENSDFAIDAKPNSIENITLANGSH